MIFIDLVWCVFNAPVLYYEPDAVIPSVRTSYVAFPGAHLINHSTPILQVQVRVQVASGTGQAHGMGHISPQPVLIQYPAQNPCKF